MPTVTDASPTSSGPRRCRWSPTWWSVRSPRRDRRAGCQERQHALEQRGHDPEQQPPPDARRAVHGEQDEEHRHQYAGARSSVTARAMRWEITAVPYR